MACRVWRVLEKLRHFLKMARKQIRAPRKMATSVDLCESDFMILRICGLGDDGTVQLF